MLNNFTQKQYQPCNIILDSTQARGALLLGDLNSATDQQLLHQHAIKTVITAALGLQHLQIPSFVTHIVYPLQDAKSQNIRIYFDQSFLTIDRRLAQGGVLVHCAAGVSRSATLVIAYIMRKNMIGFRPAIGLVKTKRPEVCPNLGFEMQLKKYQAQLLSGQPKQQPKLIKRNISQKLNEEKRLSFDIKKVDNFDFEPLQSANKKKVEIKKGITRHTGYSKPREKPLYDVMETELFVSGKSAKRPASQARNLDNKAKNEKLSLLGTWGPLTHKQKQFQF